MTRADGVVVPRSPYDPVGASPIRIGYGLAMEILSSRVLLHPTDLERSRTFYRDALGLAIAREFGTPDGPGTVFFLGGGQLEVSGHGDGHPTDGLRLWLQVRDADAAHAELKARGVPITREPRREPWGLIEMWIADPDGVAICVVQIPEDHPMRSRGMPDDD